MTPNSSVTPAAVWGTKPEICRGWGGRVRPLSLEGPRDRSSSGSPQRASRSLFSATAPHAQHPSGCRDEGQEGMGKATRHPPRVGHSGQTRKPAREFGAPGAGQPAPLPLYPPHLSPTPPPSLQHLDLNLPRPSTQVTGFPKTASAEREMLPPQGPAPKTWPANE